MYYMYYIYKCISFHKNSKQRNCFHHLTWVCVYTYSICMSCCMCCLFLWSAVHPFFLYIYIYNNVTFLHYFVVKVNMKSKLVPALKWLYFWNTYFSWSNQFLKNKIRSCSSFFLLNIQIYRNISLYRSKMSYKCCIQAGSMCLSKY